VVRVSNS